MPSCPRVVGGRSGVHFWGCYPQGIHLPVVLVLVVVVVMVVQQPAAARAAQCNPSSMDGQNGKWAFPKSLQGSRVRKEGSLNRGGANLALGLYIESIYPDRPLVVVNERWSSLIWLWLCCCCSLQCFQVYVLYMSPYKYTPGLGTGRECSSALPDIHRE